MNKTDKKAKKNVPPAAKPEAVKELTDADLEQVQGGIYHPPSPCTPKPYPVGPDW